MKVVHIGLGRTASTYIQKYLFPYLHDLGLTDYYNPTNLLYWLDCLLLRKIDVLEYSKFSKNFSKFDNIIISAEALVGWDPSQWDDMAERNYQAFGEESLIVLALREPRSYLVSLYKQVVKSGYVVKPEDYFLTNSRYTSMEAAIRPGMADAINVDKFNYKRLVDLYCDKFNSVLVVPLCAMNNPVFLKVMCPEISEQQYLDVVNHLKNKRPVNTSYSLHAMNIRIQLGKALSCLGVKSKSGLFHEYETALDSVCPDNGLSRSFLIDDKCSSKNIIKYFKEKISLHYFLILISRLFRGRKKFNFSDEACFGVHVGENVKYYEDLVKSREGYYFFTRS